MLISHSSPPPLWPNTLVKKHAARGRGRVPLTDFLFSPVLFSPVRNLFLGYDCACTEAGLACFADFHRDCRYRLHPLASCLQKLASLHVCRVVSFTVSQSLN